MRSADGIIIYDSLEEQYRHVGIPVDTIKVDTDFTIFNLADLKRPMPFSLPLSRLNFFVFGFIKNAFGSYTIDEQHFEMKPGTIYFTNPGHLRTFKYTEINEAYLVTFSEDFLKESIPADVYHEFPFLLAETLPAMTAKEEIFEQFERLFLQINQEYISFSPFRKKLIGSLFYALLLKYKEYFWMDYSAIQEGSRSSEIVKRFKRILEKNYRDLSEGRVDHAFRLQDYADLQNLHPNYLSNVIKTKTGKTIGTWIAEKSIAEAKSMLKNTNAPVKAISDKLGFGDTSNFSAHFKKHTGVSPIAYRNAPN